MTPGRRDEGVREIKRRKSRERDRVKGKGQIILRSRLPRISRPATLKWQEDAAG